jgi:hypothetical protein
MKNSILVAGVAVVLMTIQACNYNKSIEKNGPLESETISATNNHDGHNHPDGDQHDEGYRCEMDCEKGKTYHEPGKCPVCEMELILVEDQEHVNHNR